MSPVVQYALLVLFLLGPCTHLRAAPPDEATWRKDLHEVMERPEYRHAHWGALVVDVDSGDTLLEQNADKLFAPASVTKLFTVAAAWKQFGPDYRFVTPVYRAGTVDDRGRLKGHLILVGSGDPSLGGRTTAAGGIAFRNSDHIYADGANAAQLTEEEPLAGLDQLAKQVSDSGIRHVEGDILVDARMFDPAPSTGSGPARVSPVTVNDNLVDFVVTAAATPGEAASVRHRPETALLAIDANITTGEMGSKPEVHARWVGAARIVVRGSVPAGHPPVVQILEWPQPDAFARGLFMESLRRAGVTLEASVFAAPDDRLLPPLEFYATAPRVAALQSPSFADEAKLILKVSHNLHASTLPLLLAAAAGKRTLADGMQQEGELLSQLGVDRDSISLGGGAGGDRADYVTPRATIQLLRAMAGRDDFDRFRAALPVLGVDGTLATVVGEDSPARGKVFAKTGTLYWDNALNSRPLLTSKALAGYIDAASGRRLAFALFVNLTHLPEATETVREGRALGHAAEILQQGL